MDGAILELVEEDSLGNMFKKLDIDPELQVSIVTKLAQLPSPSHVLCQEKRDSSSVKMSMVYTRKTVSEEAFLRQLRKKIDAEVFNAKNGISVEATHVVVGVDWGYYTNLYL